MVRVCDAAAAGGVGGGNGCGVARTWLQKATLVRARKRHRRTTVDASRRGGLSCINCLRTAALFLKRGHSLEFALCAPLQFMPLQWCRRLDRVRRRIVGRHLILCELRAHDRRPSISWTERPEEQGISRGNELGQPRYIMEENLLRMQYSRKMMCLGDGHVGCLFGI